MRKKTMLRTMLAAMLLVCSSVAYAQWDLEGVEVDRTKWRDFVPTWNPDPFIMTPGAGSAGSSVRQGEKTGGKNSVRRATPQQAAGLPDYWDNAKTKYFPPVFSQAGGSCGAASRIGYMLTEELNAYRGTNASLQKNRMAPNFQHPYDVTGPNKNTMASQIGFPDAATYGGFPYSNVIGFHNDRSAVAGWMQGYDKYYKAMHNRLARATSIPVGIIGYPENNPEGWGRGGFGPGALAAKRWLYNHNGDESFHTGGLLGLGVACGGTIMNVPNTQGNRSIGVNGKKYWATGTSVDHAVTICGYDDRIEFDLDANGVVGERRNSLGYDEKGAWIIVNSWGGWANNGFIYVPYALASPTCKKHTGWRYTYADDGVTKTDSVQRTWYTPNGNGFTPEMWHIRKDHTPARTVKLKISFSQRSAISLKAGIAKNVNATAPEKTVVFEHFNYKGDAVNDGKDAMTPMLGKWANGMHYEPMEIGFDLTDLQSGYDMTQPLKYFFIVDSKNTATGVGGIHEAYIIDYTYNANGIETPFVFSGDSVNIANGGTRTIISTVVRGDILYVPQNLRIVGTELHWDAPQAAAHVPQGYVICRNGTEIGQAGSEMRYNIGSAAGTYTVKAAYLIDGKRKLSAASAAAKSHIPFTRKYVSYIGAPIASLGELQDDMSVILYNVGRERYVCDTGQGTYQFSNQAPSTLTQNACQYVFKVKKVGNAYTFTSENGSLPAFKSNNATVAVADAAGNFTVTVANANNKTFYLKNGSYYLNGNPSVPVTWSGAEQTSQHRIIPVHVSSTEITGLGDYTTVTKDNLKDGQIVALYNNGRKYYVVDEGGDYAAATTVPTTPTEKYLFRVGKNTDGTFTFTSVNGAIPVLPYNEPFAPSSKSDCFTVTSAGTGLFFLQSSTPVASAGGKQERQYLNGNEQKPVGWNVAGANSKYRIYPVLMNAPAPVVSITAPENIQAACPVQLGLTGDEDLISCTWIVDGNTYSSITPTVTFTSAGSKTVQCTAVNMKGQSTTVSRVLTVQAAPALSADFTFSKTSVPGGEQISFHASNPLPGCTYLWNMPNTRELTANTRSTSATYLSVGQQPVTLTVTAPNGAQKVLTKNVTVTLVPPVPAYELSEKIILKGESVTITDKSLYSPTSWSWTLLRGNNPLYQSSEQNPTFTPTVAGKYKLMFTAANAKGNTTASEERALLVCNAASYTGLEFAGGNSRVTANLPEGISDAWTVEFWLNPTSLQGENTGIFGSNGLSLTANEAGVVTLKQGSTVLAASAKAYYVVGEWRHYAISYINGYVYFNRDGVEFSRGTCSVSDFSNSFRTLQIGGSAAPLQGMIDEFRVWSAALSAAQLRTYAVAPIADLPAAVQNDGLLLYYQFNQNSGNCVDATSYGNVGTRLGFGPDGDAWSDSKGVFAINFEDNAPMIAGGMLNQTLYRVADVSDEEIVNEFAPATNVVDGKDATFWHGKYKPTVIGYPHGITFDRSQLDEILSLRLYAERDATYRPTLISISESDNGTSWTPVLTNVHVIFNGNSSEIMLPRSVTKRLLKIEFPAGGNHLAVNEIFFYGKDGEVINNLETTNAASGHSVTWRIYDETGSKLLRLYRQMEVEEGTEISELPEALRIKGCVYSPVSAVVNKDMVIDVNCTWNQFTVSTPGDTIYHHLKLNGKYARWDAGTGKVVLGAAQPGADEVAGKWAFFGNPYSGFLVVNAAVPDLYLTSKAGNKEYAILSAGGTRFTVRGSDSQSGGFLMQVNQNVAYLNDYANEGKVAIWANENAVNGVGSAFSTTSASDALGCTVVWEFYDATGTTLWKTFREKGVAQGTVKNAIPEAMRLDGCEYSFTNTTVNSNVTTIPVLTTWSHFPISTRGDAVYCHVKLKGCYLKYNPNTGKEILEASLGNSAAPESLWAFFGNPYAGFIVTNAATPDLQLQGFVQNGAHTQMSLVGTRFTSRPSAYSGGGFVLQVGREEAYLNDFANHGVLGTWASANGLSGIGSAFSVTIVGGTNDGAAKSLNDGAITDVKSIEASDTGETKIYDLQGRQLRSLQKGINIVNGKKIVIK